ncbi:MAG: OmpH family outer membrane protein [Tidjanibacter sp.]|nr:OmpH family outer membrane protein [Tidjanibacter sp.]
MKSLMKLSLALVALLAATLTSYAQPKFGYVNSQEIIVQMPELQEVQVSLEKLQNELSEQLEIIQVEYNNRLAEYQKNAANYSDAIRQSKEQELISLQQRYEELGKAGSQDMQNQQAKLMQPVIEKARAAIDKIASEGGYTAIFDMAAASLAYYDKNQMTDIAPLVKKELGIPENATPVQ